MNDDADILLLMWGRARGIEGEVFRTVAGEDIVVSKCGESGGDSGMFSSAEILAGGRTVCGDVVFGQRAANNVSPYTILQVVSRPGFDTLMRYDGVRVPQIVIPIPQAVRRSVESLRAGSGSYECGVWLGDVTPLTRVSIYENLLLERLERKCGDIMTVLEATGGDWAQTFHTMLFRAMGGNRNREPYMKLASKATYHMVLRERSSVTIVESLLLGTSGLLEGCYFDDYIHSLRDHYKYLCSKYTLKPMRADEWESGRYYPRSLPIQRIVQLASFLAGQDFVFDRLLSCRTRADVHKLFSAEASHYWTTHYIPDGSSKMCPKRIGEDKADSLGINLVIPMLFSYGIYSGREELKDAAMSLITEIPVESNTIVRGWTGMGAPACSAADSQSLIQLRNEYCTGKRCTECRIGKRLIAT